MAIRFPCSVVLLAMMVGCNASKPGSPSADKPPAALQRFQYNGMKMGSDYHLILYAPDQATADAAAKAADAEIDRLEMVFSDYKPESELSKLCRLTAAGPMTQPVEISDDLYEVLWASQVTAAETQGAFDVTVGPYIQLWRRSRRQQELPSVERLVEVAPAVGYRKLKLTPEAPLDGDEPDPADRKDLTNQPTKAQLTAAKMRLDVGGIATGYIADRVLVLLRDRGIESALCDLSGDLAIGDAPPGREGWTVAIRSVTEPDKTDEYLLVANCGVSTSGDTYRFVEIDGTRYSHIVDSKTGLGLTRRVGATIVARDGMTADRLATAVCLIGSDQARALLTETGAHGKVMEWTGAKVNKVESEGYTALKTKVLD